MFTTIQEGVEAYKAEVREYVSWVDETRAANKMKPEDSAFDRFDKIEWAKALEWNAKMAGMVKALGLTENEVKALDAECGVKEEPALNTP